MHPLLVIGILVVVAMLVITALLVLAQRRRRGGRIVVVRGEPLHDERDRPSRGRSAPSGLGRTGRGVRR